MRYVLYLSSFIIEENKAKYFFKYFLYLRERVQESKQKSVEGRGRGRS